MQRPADTTYPLHDFLHHRWSPLAFADRPLPAESVGSLLEAARWAPSCYNDQPWSFVIATRDQTAEFERLASCLVDANRVWAARAPLLALTVARLHFDHNGKENRHAWYDVGQAAAHLTFQAAALGLFVHQMGGFDPQRARMLYDIPPTHEPASMMAVGYYGDATQLPDELRARETAPRRRKPLRDFVFAGRWNQPAAIATR